ncbi:MAG TPA: sialidase family protein [Vicinamibacterales bacterium]|nr:sialidase family protein [Vicinamibacterales bacterium]
MLVGRSVAAVTIAAGLATQAVPAQRPPAPQITFITPDTARRPAEVSVAINPANPDHVLAVMLQSGRPGEPRVTNYSYSSPDGGQTWKGVLAHNAGRVQGDDVVTFGADGTAYHAYIAFDGIRVDRPERAWSGIFVRSSRDGLAWNEPVAVVDHINTAIPFEDKPWIAVDRGSSSAHRGNIYVAWTRFDIYGSENPAHRSHIMLSRSRNGGRSFSPPIEISDDTGDARDSDNTVEGAVPVAGPNGEVYIAWAGPKGLVFDKSTDGGWTFGTDVMIAAMPGGWDSPVPGLERHNGMPVTSVDPSNGPNRGTIYVNWIDARNGDPDVFVAASKDSGKSWSAPVRVNDDPKGATQMFTWLAVDPIDGSLNLIFHDRRGLTGTMTGVTLARSIDGGKTFANYPLAVTPFDCCKSSSFFGDYNGIDAYGGRVVATFPVLIPSNGNSQAVLAAIARFRPGTQELR